MTPDNAEDGPSTPMLDAATHGQVLENNNDSGQEKSDEMDDSSQHSIQLKGQGAGPAPASDENLPRELTNPSDVAYTLPEEQ